MFSIKMAIVCNGKELSYGVELLHLMKYADENNKFSSEMCKDFLIELYSMAIFNDSSVSKNSIKIFINDTQKINSSFVEVFNKYGMHIYNYESSYILKSDLKSLKDEEYEHFIKYANEKRKEYITFEKDYVKKVEKLNKGWIHQEFKNETNVGLFRNKKRIQQQYACMAFLLYIDFFRRK